MPTIVERRTGDATILSSRDIEQGYIGINTVSRIRTTSNGHITLCRTNIYPARLHGNRSTVRVSEDRTDDLETKVVRADLYILAKDGTEFLFEIKAPKPNKGQCLEVLQRLLRFHLLRGANRPQIQAYYAMPYNPYGATKADYKWTQAKNYLPFDQAVVMGNDFWNIVGGETAYEKLPKMRL